MVLLDHTGPVLSTTLPATTTTTPQAVQLGVLPPLTIRQTSHDQGGQIYMPAVNTLLFIAVMAVMLVFQSSARLATAYGVSVTGALVVDTLLLLSQLKPLNGPRTQNHES